VLVTEWENIGSYRRALGNYDVKLRATPLLGESADLPSSFESLVEISSDGARTAHSSDLA
jgi:heme oxygenase (mycobilin-producing)